MKRIAITGSRNWTDREAVWYLLDCCRRHFGPFILVHGGCDTGADAIAHAWARARGSRVEVFFADWASEPTGGGPIRNCAMAESRPDLCYGFPLRGTGTWGCMREMVRCGVLTHRYTAAGDWLPA